MRRLGDELGLARAAYLRSDLAWLSGDLEASYRHAGEMLASARGAGSDFDAATALVFMAWCVVEGPWPAPDAIALCDALLVRCRARGAAEPRRLPGGADGDDRTLRRGARGDGARARRLRRPAARPAWPRTWRCSSRSRRCWRATRWPPSAPSATPRRWCPAPATAGTRRWSTSTSPRRSSPRAAGRTPPRCSSGSRRMPAPCDVTWVIKRHIVRARLAAHAGDSGVALAEAEAAVAVAEPTSLLLARADAQRALADAHRAARPHGRRGGRTAARARAGRAQGQPRRRRPDGAAARGRSRPGRARSARRPPATAACRTRRRAAGTSCRSRARRPAPRRPCTGARAGSGRRPSPASPPRGRRG